MAKIAIVCGSPSWINAPFGDPEWQIWGLGNQLDKLKTKGLNNVHLLFELHENLTEHDKRYPEYLASLNIPLITSDKFPVSGDHISQFDYSEASKLLHNEYFTSSCAVMMAHAIMMGATEIAVYGVDMAVDDHEYFMQRPCMEGWIGYAKGKGIKVSIAEESPLCKYTYNEGRDWNNTTNSTLYSENDFSRMAETHTKHIDELNAKIAQLQAAIQSHDGARQAYTRLAKVARAVDAGIDVKSICEGFESGKN